MKQGPGRFRRAVTACAAGTIALSFLSVLAIASPASALPTQSGTTVAASTPSLVPGVNNQPAGNWTVTLTPGATGSAHTCAGGPNPGRIQIAVADFNEITNINYDILPTIAAPSTVGNAGFAICGSGSAHPATISSPGTLNFFYEDTSATTVNQVINITNVAYDVGASHAGAVLVRGTNTDTGYGNSGVAQNLTPVTASLDGVGTPYDPSATNAIINGSPTAFLSTITAVPVIAPGTTGAAANWNLNLSGIGHSWVTGDKEYITVARNDRTNCETVAKPDSIAFSGTPILLGSATSGAATAVPAATATLAAASGSSCGVTNELVLTFTNSGTITTSSPGAVNLTIVGVNYAVSADTYPPPVTGFGTGTNLGPITVASGYNTPPTFSTSGIVTPPSVPNDVLVGAAVVPASNANINGTSLVITSNKPSTNIQINVTSHGGEVVNQPVSPITIAEGSPGSLGGGVVGWACIALSPLAGPGTEAEFNTLPTVTATGGGIVVGNVSLLTPGGFAGPSELAFQVTTASSGSPGTVTVSGITVNVPNTFSSALNAELVSGANSVSDACSYAKTGVFTSGTAYVAPLTGNHFFPVASIVGRIWGQDQDGTAAQVFEFNPPSCSNSLTATVPAVLVTNGSYQDALSASYLAGQLGTGILTTNTNTVSPEALQALALDGVTQVFVVGGPLVVSPADVTQLENTPSYRCGTGGVTPRLNALGQTRNLIVQQIFGQTADDTAGAVATFSGAGTPGASHFPAAYGGAYNDTSGSSGSPASSAPDTSVATAILATNQSFTDAASASAIAYTNHFPLVLSGQDTLSPAAAEALTNDSIQQVIVMGGPIAISDNVLSQVEAMGIVVLRVAGQDFTDTSQLLARFELASSNSIGGPPSGLDYDPFYLSIARGDYYTDAIVVSRVSVGVPILLTWDPNSTSQPGGTDFLGTFLTAAGQGLGLDIFGADGTINNLLLAGGTFAISNPLATTLGTDLNG